jgi:hypothetical protein
MELLESSFVRPRQARYQVTLRPTVDTALILLYLYFPFLVAIATAVPELCQIAVD